MGLRSAIKQPVAALLGKGLTQRLCEEAVAHRCDSLRSSTDPSIIAGAGGVPEDGSCDGGVGRDDAHDLALARCEGREIEPVVPSGATLPMRHAMDSQHDSAILPS